MVTHYLSKELTHRNTVKAQPLGFLLPSFRVYIVIKCLPRHLFAITERPIISSYISVGVICFTLQHYSYTAFLMLIILHSHFDSLSLTPTTYILRLRVYFLICN